MKRNVVKKIISVLGGERLVKKFKNKTLQEMSIEEIKQSMESTRANSQLLEQDIKVLQNEIKKRNKTNISQVPESKINYVCQLFRQFERLQQRLQHFTLNISVPISICLNVEDSLVDYEILDEEIFEKLYRSLEKTPALNKKIKKTQKIWTDMEEKIKEIAKQYDIEEDVIWDVVDPNNFWH